MGGGNQGGNPISAKELSSKGSQPIVFYWFRTVCERMLKGQSHYTYDEQTSQYNFVLFPLSYFVSCRHKRKLKAIVAGSTGKRSWKIHFFPSPIGKEIDIEEYDEIAITHNTIR